MHIWYVLQKRGIVYLDRFRWCHLQHHKYKLIWIPKKSWDKISKNFSNSTIIITGWYYYIGVSLLIYSFQNVIKCIHHKRNGAYKLSRLLYVILHEMQNIVLIALTLITATKVTSSISKTFLRFFGHCASRTHLRRRRIKNFMALAK